MLHPPITLGVQKRPCYSKSPRFKVKEETFNKTPPRRTSNSRTTKKSSTDGPGTNNSCQGRVTSFTARRGEALYTARKNRPRWSSISDTRSFRLSRTLAETGAPMSTTSTMVISSTWLKRDKSKSRTAFAKSLPVTRGL